MIKKKNHVEFLTTEFLVFGLGISEAKGYNIAKFQKKELSPEFSRVSKQVLPLSLLIL